MSSLFLRFNSIALFCPSPFYIFWTQKPFLSVGNYENGSPTRRHGLSRHGCPRSATSIPIENWHDPTKIHRVLMDDRMEEMVSVLSATRDPALLIACEPATDRLLRYRKPGPAAGNGSRGMRLSQTPTNNSIVMVSAADPTRSPCRFDASLYGPTNNASSSLTVTSHVVRLNGGTHGHQWSNHNAGRWNGLEIVVVIKSSETLIDGRLSSTPLTNLLHNDFMLRIPSIWLAQKAGPS